MSRVVRPDATAAEAVAAVEAWVEANVPAAWREAAAGGPAAVLLRPSGLRRCSR